MTHLNPLEFFPHAFAATHMRRLVDRIAQESRAMFEDFGIAADPKTISVLIYVDGCPESTIADVAGALGHSHQLASQRVAKLIRDGLVRNKIDEADSRRRPLVLTEDGRSMVRKLVPLLELLDEAFLDLFTEIESDLSSLANRALQALERRPLEQRFPTRTTANA